MISCPSCTQASPDGSLHCVHCGHRLETESAAEKTQFGMPMLRPAPASAKSSGPQTTQFGAEDLARLAAATKDDAPDEEAARQAASPLAGLPRPRVASAPSPLTEGLKKPIKVESRPKPSARSTVIGMPLFGATPAPGATDEAEPESAPSPAPATPGGAAILSLDALDMPSGGDAAPEPTLAMMSPIDDSTQPTGPTAGAEEATLAMQTPLRSPGEAGHHPPTELAQPALPSAPDAPTQPRVTAAKSPAPVAGPKPSLAKPAANPAPSRPAAPPRPAVAPAPRSEPASAPASAPADAPDADEAEGRGGMSRGLAGAIGLTLIGLFAYPVAKAWFWEVLGNLSGLPLVYFIGVGGAGLVALLAALLPLANGARIGLSVVMGLLGVACLFLFGY